MSDYRDGSGIADLASPENDVRALARVLQDRYGFEVQVLESPQATRQGILDALDGLRRSLREDSALLVYYAGHGFYDQAEERGYWLPSDATAASRSNWIANDDLAARMRALPARHVLLLSDACFSGALFRDLGTATGAGIPEATAEARRLAADRSRWVITSGGNEPVVDRYREGLSVFAYFLTTELDRAGARYVVPDTLFPTLRERVMDNAKQEPRQGPFQGTGHEGGQLVFVNPGAAERNVDILALAAREKACRDAVGRVQAQAADEWRAVEQLLSVKDATSRGLVEAWIGKWQDGVYVRCEGGGRQAEIAGVGAAKEVIRHWTVAEAVAGTVVKPAAVPAAMIPVEPTSIAAGSLPTSPATPTTGARVDLDGETRSPSRSLLAAGLGSIVAGGVCLGASWVLDQQFLSYERKVDAEPWYVANHVTFWSGAGLGVVGTGLVVGAAVRGRW